MFETKLMPVRFWYLAVNFAMVSIAVILPGEKIFAQGRSDLLVQTGVASPDGNGVFSSINGVQFNGQGQMIIEARLTGTSGGGSDDFGIYRLGGGPLTQIMRSGQAVPGGNGVFGYSYAQVLKDSGDVVFGSTVRTPNTSYEGFYQGNEGGILDVVKDGDSPINGNGAFTKIFLLGSGENRSTIRGRLSGTAGGGADNEGIFHVSKFGAIREALRIGETVTGFGKVIGFETHAYSANAIGQSAVTVEGINRRGEAIIRNSGAGQNSVIVKAGDLVPGGDGTIGGFSPTPPLINSQGQVAFAADVNTATSTETGIYFGTGGLLTEVTRTGRQAPNNSGTFKSLGSKMRANDVGEFSFWGYVENTDGDRAGLFRGDGNTVVQVAIDGQTVQDGNGQIRLGNSAGALINNTGQFAYDARIDGTSGGTSDNNGLFTGDGRDSFTIARKGDAVGGSTISELFVNDVNDLGQITYRLKLADGNERIQRWTPELHWREDYGGAWDGYRQWTLGVTPDAVHDVYIDPAARLTVYGSQSDTVVRSLNVGGNTGVATLELINGRALTATNGVNIGNKGVLTGDGIVAGNVLNNYGGTLLADNLTVVGSVSNFGVIRGTGSIQSAIYNGIDGQIRANNGDQLSLTGPSLINEGRIEVIGGELQVAGEFINGVSTGMIAARNGTMRFDNGLFNDGSIGVSFGTSDVFGDIINNGTISVSGGANATFYDDIEQNGAMQIVKSGSVESNVVVFGALSGPGGFVGGGNLFALGDLRPGASPASVLYDGNLYMGSGTRSFMELGGTGIGDFDQMVVTGDLGLSGELLVSLIDGHSLFYNQQYLIADVDGMLTGQFSGLAEGDLIGNFDGFDMFVSYSMGDGNDVGLFTAVPEPAAAVLLIPAFVLFLSRRKRRTV